MGAFAWHLLLDLTILFPHATESPVAIIIGLAGALLTVPAAWTAGRWLPQESRTSAVRSGSLPW